jgi:ribosomal protein S4
MAIKRYLPKYKKLARFYYPLWFEKRTKIRKFNKQKWERIKRLYYPRKLKFFRQDVSAYPLTRRYGGDRSIRLKKTYKNILRDKQRLQLYYGVGRLRFFQLKNMAKKIKSRVFSKELSLAKSMLSLFENRLDVALYRLSIVNSISQARKLIQDGRIKVGSVVVNNTKYLLKPNDLVSLDPSMKDRILGLYLRHHLPYFFFRYKEDRREFVAQKREYVEGSFIERSLQPSLLLLKDLILNFREKRKHDSIKN